MLQPALPALAALAPVSPCAWPVRSARPSVVARASRERVLNTNELVASSNFYIAMCVVHQQAAHKQEEDPDGPDEGQGP